MSDDSKLYFRQVAVGEMANLAYLIGDTESRQALIVDPAWNVDGLLEKADAARWRRHFESKLPR